MSLGMSADVAVGQKVYAIGNPFGLDHTLTTGIVSGIHREIQSGITGRPIQDAIQVRSARSLACPIDLRRCIFGCVTSGPGALRCSPWQSRSPWQLLLCCGSAAAGVTRAPAHRVHP